MDVTREYLMHGMIQALKWPQEKGSQISSPGRLSQQSNMIIARPLFGVVVAMYVFLLVVIFKSAGQSVMGALLLSWFLFIIHINVYCMSTLYAYNTNLTKPNKTSQIKKYQLS